MTFFEYLKDQNILYTQVGEDIAEISGKTYKYQELKEGVHFDEEFNLVHNNLGYDFHVIYFGGRYYYIPMGSEEDFELKELKHIGEPDFTLETDYFLGVHSNYEILSGSGSFKDWATKAKWLGCKALGISDTNTMAGMMKFQEACDRMEIKPILGATFTVKNINGIEYDIKLFIKNYQGWINMLTINKLKNVDGELKDSDVLANEEGLVVVLDPKTMPYDESLAFEFLDEVYYILDMVEYEDETKDEWVVKNMQQFIKSKFKPLPYGDAYYINKEDSYIKSKLSEMSSKFDYESNNQYFKSKEEYLEEMIDNFADEEKAEELFMKSLKNEKELVSLCNFRITTGERHLPEYELAEDEIEKYGDKETMFFSLIEEGLGRLYPKYTDGHLDRIKEEVETLEAAMVIDYFLNTRAIIQFAINESILVGYGRGSAAGSIISYLLGIVYVDPIEFKLLFSRFLNKGRTGEQVDVNIIEIELEDGTVRKYAEDDYVVIKEEGKLKAIKAKELIENMNI